MFEQLPSSAFNALDWGEEQYRPYFDDLAARDLTAATIDGWLHDWTRISRLAYEVYSRLYVATSVDTTDKKAESQFKSFMEVVYPMLLSANNTLNRKLLDSGLTPDGFEIPLRNIRAEVELFREENLPLLTEESNLQLEYDKIVGAQTVEWQGEEKTLKQMVPLLQENDRAIREQVWRLTSERQLENRTAFNELWVQFMSLRANISDNAGMPDYRAYCWKAMNRFDYSPQDSLKFLDAIEQVVVPAASRLYEKRRTRLGLDTLRPWDTAVDVEGRDPLRPYETIAEMKDTLEDIFKQVDPRLGEYFHIMRDENLLDLENRKGKAPGGYCTDFPLVQRPFIFMNAVGLHDDVQTLLHEGGHSFHVFESVDLPYIHQADVPMEFAEVASMAMELLAGPYLDRFYDNEEAARARVEKLEEMIYFWPYMAVVDAFQHWVYTNHKAATDPANCDAKWAELWDRFMIGIDFSGLDAIKESGWQRKLHIFQVPFYYVEYGLAQLGAIQVWANSLTDQREAVQKYRSALALGGTAALPDLFAAAGARFAFDPDTLAEAVELVERTITELDPA